MQWKTCHGLAWFLKVELPWTPWTQEFSAGKARGALEFWLSGAGHRGIMGRKTTLETLIGTEGRNKLTSRRDFICLGRQYIMSSQTGWWFGTCFIFPYIGKNPPNWLIFFRGVETTKQQIFNRFRTFLPRMQQCRQVSLEWTVMAHSLPGRNPD